MGSIARVAKFACNLLMAFVLVVFVWLVHEGHSGSITLLHIAKLSIKRNDKAVPAACAQLLNDVARLRAASSDESNRLGLLDTERAAFEKNYSTNTRYWGAPGTDTSKWGPGLWENKRVEEVAAEQRKIVEGALDKLNASVDAIQAKCQS